MLALFTDFVTNEIVQYGYLAIFVLMLLGIGRRPHPVRGHDAVRGSAREHRLRGGGHELSLLWVGLAGTAGNLVGSWIAYGAGAWGGRPLLDRFGRYLLIRPHEIDKAHDWFERHGDAAVFFSRLLPVIRTFISVPAGVARMNFAKFTLYTILGCLPWTFALAWMGYVLGDNWTAAEQVIRPVAWAIAVAIGAGGIWWITRRWRRVREEYAARDRERADQPS